MQLIDKIKKLARRAREVAVDKRESGFPADEAFISVTASYIEVVVPPGCSVSSLPQEETRGTTKTCTMTMTLYLKGGKEWTVEKKCTSAITTHQELGR